MFYTLKSGSETEPSETESSENEPSGNDSQRSQNDNELYDKNEGSLNEQTKEDAAQTQEKSGETEESEIPASVSADEIPVTHLLSEADITFSEEERNSAPVTEARVSPAEPVVTCGDVTVDFKSWNLDNDEDTLIVKELPVKTDENTGYTITAYDFSLASDRKSVV